MLSTRKNAPAGRNASLTKNSSSIVAFDGTRTPKRQSRGLETRKKLLAGARRALEERGYHGTRVSDITDYAGVALGNFYRHFETKNDIFAEVLRPVFEYWHATSGRISGEGQVRTIDELAKRNRRYIKYFSENRLLLRAGYEASASIKSDHFFGTWYGLREMFFARARTWLNSLQREGILRESVNTELTAEALGAMNEQFIYMRVVSKDAELSAEEVDTMARMLAEIWWRTLFE